MSQTGEPFDPYYQWLGIPPDQQPPNHYRLLGIQLFEENREVIRNAADRQMAHLRSFQSGPRGVFSQRLLNEIAAAKLCLLSAEKKVAYDQSLKPAVAADDGSQRGCVPEPAGPPVVRTGPSPGDPDLPSLFQPARSGISVSTPSRLARPHRRRIPQVAGALVLLAAGVGLVGGYLAIQALLAEDETDRLVLLWADDARDGAELVINGETRDLRRDAVARRPGVLEFPVQPGSHRVRITRDGYQPIDERFELLPGGRVEMTVGFTRERAAATVHLQWPVGDRDGAILEINGRVCDLATDPLANTPRELRFALPAGNHQFRIVRGDEVILDRSIELEDGKPVTFSARVPRSGNEMGSPESPRTDGPPLAIGRVHLAWPDDQRDGAVLTVDGEPYDLSAALEQTPQTLILALEPGRHTVRITRDGYERYERSIDVPDGDLHLAVSLAAPTPTDPDDGQRDVLQELLRAVYREYPEYRQWQEAEGESRRQQLRFLIARLVAEAEKRPVNSLEQRVAYDESIELALEHDDYVQAHQILDRVAAGTAYSDAERAALRIEIWNRAIASAQLDTTVEYLRARSGEGAVLDDAQQAAVVDRLVAAADLADGLREAERRVTELREADVLSPVAALHARGAIYAKLAKGTPATPDTAVQLGENILTLVGEMLRAEGNHSWTEARGLVDAVNSLRVAALKDPRGNADLRARAVKLAEHAKDAREEVLVYQRVTEAQIAIAEGTATSDQHRLVGFWHLQLGRFPEALPHLRDAGDEALARLAVPIPDTAGELVELARSVDQESRRPTHTRRNAEALRAYALYLRQTAFEKDDGSLAPPQRQELESRLEQSDADAAYLWPVPKGKWHNLIDLATVEELRSHSQQTAAGSWTIQDDGTIATNTANLAKLELPLELGPTYGVRLMCRRSSGSDVNVHLPVGATTAVLTLGGENQLSGLQLIDGGKIGEPANPTTIPRDRFAFRRDVPVTIEIQVEHLVAEGQTARQRRMTGGEDWVTIAAAVDGRPLCNASLATSRVAPPETLELSRAVLGLSARARVAFGAIQVVHK